MAQHHRAPDLPLSDSSPCPSFRQHSLPTLSSSRQPLFTQRLIPRDFLGLRPKQSPNLASEVEDTVLKTIFTGNPFQDDRDKHQDRTRHPWTDSSDQTVSSTEKSLSDTVSPHENGLNVSQTKSPDAVDTFPQTTKAEPLSSDSPAIVESSSLTRATMPRNSSIDSAISSISTTSLNRINGDVGDTSPTSVRNLIATAGGAENLVTHLLKDKNSIASQNAQLWKLVEKQRALIFGLNKDLERLNKERDRYKKRAKDLEIQTPHTDGDIRQQVSPSPEKILVSTTAASDLSQHLHTFDDTPANRKTHPPAIAVDSGCETLIRAQQEHVDQDKENKFAEQDSQPILPAISVRKPESPGLSLPYSKLQIPNIGPPTFNLTEASPLVEKPNKSMLSTRRAPPKPLNLSQGRAFDSPTEPLVTRSELDEATERGRRRTRAEDDRDREMSAKKAEAEAEAEAEARSRSKKNKIPKPVTNEEAQAPVQTLLPAPLPNPGLPLSPRPQHAQSFAPAPVHLAVANAPQPGSLSERLLAAPLKSPGLPLSPRPANRNDNPSVNLTLPLSPRANMGAFPLSPRAPKHALPIPTNPSAPADAAALLNKQSRSHQPSPQTPTPSEDRLQVHSPVTSEPPAVYRGLAASAYPNLLLPPNALPSIQVRVHSSRLRPSRYGVLSHKSGDENTVFSLSVLSRSSNSELWRVEKTPSALPQLEQILRPCCLDLPRMPDRKLFAGGQSPVLLDERRTAIDNYFDELLDTHVNEQAAVAICRFLSTDVVDPEQETRSASSAGSEKGISITSPEGHIIKSGVLTKRGKNFGGWKTRFFILESVDFRYYEAAGGPCLGTIRLTNALIGKQRDSESSDDGDGQYRHAFLIQEPKRKDSGSFTRHVFCAESDADRDSWVKALLYWVERGNSSRGPSRNGSTTSATQDINDSDNRYQNSRAGPSSKETRDTHINTPTPTSGSSIDSPILDHVAPSKLMNISGPINGNPITDASMWGPKAQTPFSKDVREKSYKMGNIFGFKRPDPAHAQPELKPAKPRILRHNGYVRPVFGIPLAEAVEFCAPFNVEVDLPAVVYRCIEYLRYKNAASEEGLFRLSGSNVVVRNLKERFNTEGDVDLVHEDEYHDIHAVASLFKTYLRELPSTLLTRDLHIEFIKVLELENYAEKVAIYNSLVHMLPPTNLSLLKAMSKYLLEVTQSADKNKMSVRNIGIVFSPTLNIPTPVFTMFLTEYEGIFEQQSGRQSDVKKREVHVPVSLSSDDVRSPRHQIFTDLPTPAPHQSTFHNQITMQPPRGTMTGTGEMGFMPISAIYEHSSFVPPQPVQPLTQISDMGGFNSLNGLLAPSNGPTDRARKRQSMILS